MNNSQFNGGLITMSQKIKIDSAYAKSWKKYKEVVQTILSENGLPESYTI